MQLVIDSEKESAEGLRRAIKILQDLLSERTGGSAALLGAREIAEEISEVQEVAASLGEQEPPAPAVELRSSPRAPSAQQKPVPRAPLPGDIQVY